MPNVTISLGGKILSIPGVYYQDIVQPLIPSSIPTGPLMFLAFSYGGQPFTPINFTDPNSLVSAMRGAANTDFVNFMFNPSQQVNGTQLVTLINIAPNTPSSTTLLSSGGTGVITLTSYDYGAPSNLLEVSVAPGIGFQPLGSQVTIYDSYSNTIEQGDNLGVPFEISYTGSASGVTYSVTAVNGVSTTFSTHSPNVGESITIDLTSSAFATVSQLFSYINSTSYYTALMLGNGTLPSSMLDAASSISLPKPVLGVYQYVGVTATLGDVVWFFNSSANSLASAALVSGITSSPAYALQNTALQYFTGGTTVTPSIANYASGFGVALNKPAWAVFAGIPTQAQLTSAGYGLLEVFKYNVDYLGAQHAYSASNLPYRRWRRYVTGSLLGEVPLGVQYSAQSNAINLNAYEVTYVWPGVQSVNPATNLNQTWNGHHVAAAVAGMYTGNPIAMPVTNKTITGTGVEQQASVATMTQLQNSGVLVLNYPPETTTPTFLSDVTTWQQDNSPANVFNQQVSCRFGLAYQMVQTLQPYVGIAMSPFDLARCRNATVALLNSLIYNGQNATGVLTAWNPSTLTLTFNTDTQILTVTVSVALATQVRFIPVTVTIVPANQSLIATVNTVTTVTATS